MLCIQLYKTIDKKIIKECYVIYMNNSTTIRISIETKKRLNELGKLENSYNSVISKLLDEHDRNKMNAKKRNTDNIGI